MKKPSSDGSRLENKFARWLRVVQGFERVELHYWVKGAVSTGAYQVDVLGVLQGASLWAECKDTEAGINRDHVAVLKQAVDDVRRNRDGWKPTRVAIVGRRFQQNALRLALSYGFECYIETPDGFEEAQPPIA